MEFDTWGLDYQLGDSLCACLALVFFFVEESFERFICLQIVGIKSAVVIAPGDVIVVAPIRTAYS
jgi:hypothetical protein